MINGILIALVCIHYLSWTATSVLKWSIQLNKFNQGKRLPAVIFVCTFKADAKWKKLSTK